MQETEWIQQQKVNFKNILLKSKQNTEQVSLAIFVALPIICSLCASADVCFLLFSFVSPRSLACMCACVCVWSSEQHLKSDSEWERDTNTRSYISVCVLATRSSSSSHFNSISIRFDSIHVENATQNRWKIQMLRSHFVCCCRCQPLRTKTTTKTTTRHPQQQQQLQHRRQQKSTNAVKS